jgi:hypothetical protein
MLNIIEDISEYDKWYQLGFVKVIFGNNSLRITEPSLDIWDQDWET